MYFILIAFIKMTGSKGCHSSYSKPIGGYMSEHKRLYNLLQIISLLSKPAGYSVERLSSRFSVTTRTIYRYLDNP